MDPYVSYAQQKVKNGGKYMKRLLALLLSATMVLGLQVDGAS